MLQTSTAFDAVGPHLDHALREVIAVAGAVALGAVATAVSFKVDSLTPPNDE